MKAPVIAIALLGFFAHELRAQTNAPLDLAKVGYSLGFKVGSNWAENEMKDVQLEAVLQGIRDALTGRPSKFSPEESNQQLGLYQTELQLRVAAKREAEADRNKSGSERFLTENKTKPGVITTPSGLQYKIIKAGTGMKPTANDNVTLHYRGSLVNGYEFDNSIKRGTPYQGPIIVFMRGMIEAIQLMSTGSQWQIFIPSDLAFGPGGFPQYKVGPNETIIFEAELLDVLPGGAPPQAGSGPGSEPVVSDIIRIPSAEEAAQGKQPEIIPSAPPTPSK